MDLSRKPPDEVSGRDEELATLTDRVAHGRLVLLHAPRRYGKTSPIGRLAANADATGDLAVVRVDLEGVLTIDDVARRLHDAYRKLPATTLGRLTKPPTKSQPGCWWSSTSSRPSARTQC